MCEYVCLCVRMRAYVRKNTCYDQTQMIFDFNEDIGYLTRKEEIEYMVSSTYTHIPD